jgi:hypothetical protein
VGGALSSRQGPLGWGCGRTAEKVGILSQDSLDLLWEMAPRSVFGMISGVGIRLLKYLFQLYLVLLV